MQSKAERAAYYKRWREANKEKEKAYRRQYYETHKERENARNNAYGKQWYLTHKIERLAYQAKYAEEHKEKIRAYQKNYYETNATAISEQQKLYRLLNYDPIKAMEAQRRWEIRLATRQFEEAKAWTEAHPEAMARCPL